MNREFFSRVWPVIGPAVTGYRAGAVEEILPLLRRLGIRRGARVLDVPCGYGRHAVMLARRGYRVTGVDINPDLLAMARASAAAQKVAVDFRRGDMRRLPFRGQFDVVLNLFTSFGYFGDAEDQRVLERFHRALKPGGWLIIQVVNRDFIVRHYRPQGAYRIKGFHLKERRQMDWATSIVRTDWIAQRSLKSPQGLKPRKKKSGSYGGAEAPPRRWPGDQATTSLPRVLRGTTRFRTYSCHELERMLGDAGFRQVQTVGGFRGEPLTLDSRWQVQIARR